MNNDYEYELGEVPCPDCDRYLVEIKADPGDIECYSAFCRRCGWASEFYVTRKDLFETIIPLNKKNKKPPFNVDDIPS